MLTVDDFRNALKAELREAELKGLEYLEVNAGQLHRKLGYYPGHKHYMPTCCLVLEQERGALDDIISSPPKGKGASLTIRYRLPRSRV